mgnify:CR=1 FL=1
MSSADGVDPTSLPLFAPASVNGRVDAAGGPAQQMAPVPPAAMPAAKSSGVDWTLLADLRGQAAKRLSSVLEHEGRLTSAEQRERGRAIIQELLADESQERVTSGQAPWSLQEQGALAQALDNALFGLGRLQPLIDDDTVENIQIAGADRVAVERIDGHLEDVDPVADDDEELIDFLVFLASRSEVNARPFSEAQPRLHMRLDGGARLAASAWVTRRPSVVIRRHRLREVSLQDLVERGSMTPVVASFLAALIRARKSVVVAGEQGAGKTTLVRALCSEIDPDEAIGTFETEYELHLDELPRTRHRFVYAWEARPGSGEVGPDGRQAGEITLSDLLYDSFRFNLSRQIVGEVRGGEIVAMVKAMQSGAGSISTTHARNAQGVMSKLVTCALEAGESHDWAVSALTESLDVVVQASMRDIIDDDGRKRRVRWISEILAIGPGESWNTWSSTTIFSTVPGTQRLVPGVIPDDLRDELIPYGFDADGYYAAMGTS